MEQPLFPVPGSTAPAVLLGSGPGPSPTLDIAVPMPAYPQRKPAPAPIPTYVAILDPLDPALGLRGWMLAVHHGDVATTPRHHFSRAGARPPLIAARLTALQTLGYEPVDEREAWRWQETTTLDGKRVELYACIDVRQLPHHREVAL